MAFTVEVDFAVDVRGFLPVCVASFVFCFFSTK